MEQQIRKLLSAISHPETQQDIVSSGVVEQITAREDKITVGKVIGALLGFLGVIAMNYTPGGGVTLGVEGPYIPLNVVVCPLELYMEQLIRCT